MAEQISKRSIVYEILMDFQKGNASIRQTEQKLAGVTKQTNTFGSSIGRVGALLGTTFAVSQLVAFTKQMTKLGDEVLDVRGRFNQINKSGALLGNLRKDTKGLIDDLSLMKSAIKAENFRVPLNELGKLLEFARKRANDTGQSVERMTELILEGVGKKSVKSLQEFGLSAQEVNEELKRTPDFAKAIGNIAVREFARAGNAATDYGDEIQKLEVELQNLTQKTSVGFTILFGTIAKGLNQISGGGNSIAERVEGVNDLTSGIAPLAFQLTLINKVFEKLGVNIEKEAQDARDAKNANDDLSGSLDKLAQAFILPSQAGASIGEIKEQIKQLEEQLDTVVPNSKEADTIIGRIKELSELLPKITEETKKTQDALQDYLRWIDEQSAIYDDQNEKAQEAIDRGKEKNEVLREETDLQNKIIQNNEEIEAFDAAHAKGDDILFETDAIEARNRALQAGVRIFENIGKLTGQQKAAALASIAINQAIAISEAVKDAQVVGITPIEKFAIYAAMIAQIFAGIGQAKAALSQAQGFAEGVIDIKGEGTTKSDSIPARLSKGESVMTAEETDDYKDVLWAIRKGNFDDYIQKNLFDFVNPSQINKQFEKTTTIRQAEIDYSHRFYQQLLATGEGNYYTKSGLKYLKSIDRKLTQSSSRYARP